MVFLIILVLHAGRHFGVEWESLIDSWVDVLGFTAIAIIVIVGDIRRAFHSA